MHCIGCGTSVARGLQALSKHQPLDLSISKDAQIAAKLEESLSRAQLQTLAWNHPAPGKIMLERRALKKQQAQMLIDAEQKERLCRPCLLNRNGSTTIMNPSTFDLSVYLDELRAEHGANLRVFHVLDAHDFPTGIPASVAPDDAIIVNRVDLVADRTRLSHAKEYYMREFFGKMGVPDANVFVTSVEKRWNVRNLAEALERVNVFVGPTNSGKTRLVHELAGVEHKDTKWQLTRHSTWPVPYTTQEPLELRATPFFRARKLIDTPSVPLAGFYDMLSGRVVRKMAAGATMTKNVSKYAVPKLRLFTGHVGSVGGLIALEFPELIVDGAAKTSVAHMMIGMGGIAHSKFAQRFKNMDTLHRINASDLEVHEAMRMHTQPGLRLEKALELDVRDTLVVRGLGFIQPRIFHPVPEDYRIGVYVPQGLGQALSTRREMVLEYLKVKFLHNHY